MTINRLAVVGAGFMGSGIAESAAAAGVEVSFIEPEQAPLERSRAAAGRVVDPRGRARQADAARRRSR